MLKIRLTRRGKKKQPIYRIVVAEHTRPVKGKFIEILGFYNPRTKEIGLNKEKIEKWLGNGAQPSDSVAMILRKEKIKLAEKFQKPKRYVRAKKNKKGEKAEKSEAGIEEKTKESEEKNKEPKDEPKEIEKGDKDNQESAKPKAEKPKVKDKSEDKKEAIVEAKNKAK